MAEYVPETVLTNHTLIVNTLREKDVERLVRHIRDVNAMVCDQVLEVIQAKTSVSASR